MRTDRVCPICGEVHDAACYLYNGDFLPYINVAPGDSLEVILFNMNKALSEIPPSTTTTTSTTTIISTLGYGALYNWYAATDSRDIAPIGFHVPSQVEWETLGVYLDPSTSGGLNDNIGGSKLKETGVLYWYAPNSSATNEVGFNARGSGFRGSDGVCILITQLTSFWTISSVTLTTAYASELYYAFDGLASSSYVPDKIQGYPLRFIADSGTPTTVTDNSGHTYSCITIGTQTWTALNSKETKYQNGDWIHGFDGGIYTPILDSNWVSRGILGESLMCYYNNDPNNA